MKLLSGTQAAKMIGVSSNAEFVRLFVETQQINPIIFKGRKRSLYELEEVNLLVEINKKRPKKNFSVGIVEKILQQYQSEFL